MQDIDQDYLLKVIGKQQVLIERLTSHVKGYERDRNRQPAQAETPQSESKSQEG